MNDDTIATTHWTIQAVLDRASQMTLDEAANLQWVWWSLTRGGLDLVYNEAILESRGAFLGSWTPEYYTQYSQIRAAVRRACFATRPVPFDALADLIGTRGECEWPAVWDAAFAIFSIAKVKPETFAIMTAAWRQCFGECPEA